MIGQQLLLIDFSVLELAVCLQLDITAMWRK